MHFCKRAVFFILYISTILYVFPAFAQEKLMQAVLITMDDMRPDDLIYMPKLVSFTKKNGIAVEYAFVSCPLCCPSRATMMTGLLASNHGVRGNKYPLYKQTIFETIKEQNPDIKTGNIGKYLNSYNGSYRPEFDKWTVYNGGMIYDWSHFRVNMNGTWKMIDQYVSDFFLDQANEFVDQYENDPYLLYLHFTAPHFPAQTPKDFKYNCDKKIFLSKHLNEIDKKAPELFKKMPIQDVNKMYRMTCKRARSMAYVDNIIVPFLDKLLKRGVQVIIVSDNGFMLGDYRHREKSLPYEEVIRTPFFSFNLDISPKRLTSLTDIAVNYYNDFNIIPPYQLDGLLYSENPSYVKVENFVKGTQGGTPKIPFVAHVTKKKISIQYQDPMRTKQVINLNKNSLLSAGSVKRRYRKLSNLVHKYNKMK